jgi:hypothetical protein
MGSHCESPLTLTTCLAVVTGPCRKLEGCFSLGKGVEAEAEARDAFVDAVADVVECDSAYVIWPFGRSVVSRPGQALPARSAISCGSSLQGFGLPSNTSSPAGSCAAQSSASLSGLSPSNGGLALAPLGKDIVKKGREPAGATVVVTA